MHSQLFRNLGFATPFHQKGNKIPLSNPKSVLNPLFFWFTLFFSLDLLGLSYFLFYLNEREFFYQKMHNHFVQFFLPELYYEEKTLAT